MIDILFIDYTYLNQQLKEHEETQPVRYLIMNSKTKKHIAKHAEFYQYGSILYPIAICNELRLGQVDII